MSTAEIDGCDNCSVDCFFFPLMKVYFSRANQILMASKDVYIHIAFTEPSFIYCGFLRAQIIS